MNLPTLLFRRSRLYDRALARDEEWKESPSEERMDQAFKRIQDEWKPWEEKLLAEISAVTCLPWQEKEIAVYFTWGVYPYSDPVTINLVSTIHVITHELIHRILSEPENSKKISKNWNRFMDSYPDESNICKTHIAVHAIHLEIMKKYFNEEAIKKEMESVRRNDYIRSWEIVNQEGSRNIVDKLVQGL